MGRFQPGDVVVWRTVVDGRVRTAIPHRCVSDDGTTIALWRAVGTSYKRPSGPFGAGPRGRSLDVTRWDGTHRDVVWSGHGALVLYRRGDASSVWRFPDSWYVNLERPWEPSRVGFDTRDLVLDLVIARDLSSWSWKDEDEFAEALTSGRLPEHEAALARPEGERVAAQALRREAPFDGSWDGWEPDPAWTTPQLPDGWDAP